MGIAVFLGAAVLGSALVGTAIGADGDAPLAEAGLDQELRPGETVRLDATGSYDPDGHVVDYEWQVGTPDGSTVSPLEPYVARTSFPATVVGRYEVSLTVTDDDGNTGTDTMYVLVEGDEGAGSTDSRAADPAGVPDTRSGGPGTVRGGTTAGVPCSVGNGRPVGGCPTSRDAPGSEPWARIEGPMVVESGHSYTYTATAGGLSGDRTYEWEEGDTGRRHTLAFESHGTYTTRVTVADAAGRTAASGLEVFVAPVDNERPDVEIVDPSPVSAGEHLTLSVDARDSDGRIRTTEWSPGRRVEVPTDGSTRTVRVTVTDDDGASVTDAITLSGRTMNRTIIGTDTTDVTCYFTNERQRDGRHPQSDRCVRENGNTVSLGVGPSRIEEFRQNEKVDLHWRRTTQERLDGLDADDTSTDYGVAARSPHDEADTYGLSDDRVRRVIVAQRAYVDNDETFALKGETVEDDITGDGEVNAADWDQRFRTTGDTADVDPHADATAELKRSIRADGDGERDEGGALDSGRSASASTIRGPFAGTSIDAETRRDRISDLSHRTTGGDASSGSDGRNGGDVSTGGPRGDASSAGDSTDASSTDHTDGTDDTNDADDTSTDDTDSTDDTGSTDTTGGGTSSTGSDDTGSESGGPSRHSPHGGSIVILP